MQKNLQLSLGNGSAKLDPLSGTILAFEDPQSPQRTFLLERDLYWNNSRHSWGFGTVSTQSGGRSWGEPDSWSCDGEVEHLEYAFENLGMTLSVDRSGGEKLHERYVWSNTTDEDIQLRELNIQTPFADHYPGAERSIEECVNAHIFAGGSWAWVLAQPMSGSGRSLGLRVTNGAIASYSIESRNSITESDIRGHIVLNITDYAHNSEAFGGQPLVELKAHESYTLEWDLGWFDTVSDFVDSSNPPATFSAVTAEVGESIHVVTDQKITADDSSLVITPTADGVDISSAEVADAWISIGDDAKTEITFHLSLEEAVRRRARYILDYQTGAGRIGSLAGAFLPADTRTKLTVDDGGWLDWTDGSERVGMAVMLQRGRNLGILDESVDKALDDWARFAEENLMDSTGAVRRGSTNPESDFGGRLYDVPWFGEFYAERYRAHHNKRDLDLAVKVLRRSFELGGERYLALNLAETVKEVSELVEESGAPDVARELRAHVISSADHFLEIGTGLPKHEVAYEQSIVTPLLNLLIDSYRWTGEQKYLDGLKERLPWLLAFGGPQPNARQYGIPIRHWDGYWFGINRIYGDVMPHHWSALTAVVISRLPKELKSEELTKLGLEVIRECMVNFNGDGSATCAYVYPSSVDARAANSADPLANDQDWILVAWMRIAEQEGFPRK